MGVQANPGIIMGFNPAPIANPLAMAAQAEALKGSQMQNKLAQANIDAMPAKAAQAFKDKVMTVGKNLLPMTNSADEFNQKLDAAVGGDASEFHITPENYDAIQQRLNPNKNAAKPVDQEMRNARLGLIQKQTEFYGQGKPLTQEQQDVLDLKKTLLEKKVASADQPKPKTEDQAKATGWLNQARLAHDNMEKVLESNPDAATPTLGEIVKTSMLPQSVEQIAYSPQRQLFNQAASQFSEAVLRAATGAGIQESETRQKIKELTPVYGEDPKLTKQKIAGQDMYLRSLEARSGESSGQNAQQPRNIPFVNSKGWALHRNKATGQQAYIGPNGEVEAVQ